MRVVQSKERTELHISKDGTLRIPAGLVRAAQLQAGDKVRVRVMPKQLALAGDTVTEANLSRRERMARAVKGVLEQARRADEYAAQTAFVEEPVEEEDLYYPLDKLVDTHKIHKLRKRT